MVRENKSRPRELQGWQEIAEFLGLPIATAQRWEKPGMPVHRGRRYVYDRPEELKRWVAKESSFRFTVDIATEGADLTSDLKLGPSEAQQKRKSLAQSSPSPI